MFIFPRLGRNDNHLFSLSLNQQWSLNRGTISSTGSALIKQERARLKSGIYIYIYIFQNKHYWDDHQSSWRRYTLTTYDNLKCLVRCAKNSNDRPL